MSESKITAAELGLDLRPCNCGMEPAHPVSAHKIHPDNSLPPQPQGEGEEKPRGVWVECTEIPDGMLEGPHERRYFVMPTSVITRTMRLTHYRVPSSALQPHPKVAEIERLKNACVFCAEPSDHDHAGGRCCGDCCAMHGILKHGSPEYDWVRRVRLVSGLRKQDLLAALTRIQDLEAENLELKKLSIHWREAGKGTTHWEGCWQDHRGCAIARIQKLQKELGR